MRCPFCGSDDTRVTDSRPVEETNSIRRRRQCDQCGKRHYIFGESRVDEIAERFGIDAVARLPIDPAISAACDLGKAEMLETPWLEELADRLEKL